MAQACAVWRLRGIVSGVVAAALGCSSTAFLAGHHLGLRGTPGQGTMGSRRSVHLLGKALRDPMSKLFEYFLQTKDSSVGAPGLSSCGAHLGPTEGACI